MRGETVRLDFKRSCCWTRTMNPWSYDRHFHRSQGMARVLPPQRLRHHLFAAAVFLFVEFARHRLAREFGRRTGHVPAAREQVLLLPPFGVVADVAVVHLINLGGVFGDEAV